MEKKVLELIRKAKTTTEESEKETTKKEKEAVEEKEEKTLTKSQRNGKVVKIDQAVSPKRR